MFTSEQYGLKNSPNPLKKGLFGTGMALAKGAIVIKSINYKKITIAAGILVALIIFITLWMEQTNPGPISSFDILTLPKVSVPETKKFIQETLQKVLL